MIYNEETAHQVADFLLQVKAIELQPNDPFKWASGWNSPIYCDNRKTLSHPRVRTFIRQKLVEVIDRKFSSPNMIAGVATGGIAQGVLVAQDLGVPFCYVRSSKKEHGLGNQIEGEYTPGQQVIVVEDLVSTGGSSLRAVEALRDAGLIITGMVSIFTYGFQAAEDNFEAAGVQLISLSDYDHLIDRAVITGFASESDLESLRAWREEPSLWNVPA